MAEPTAPQAPPLPEACEREKAAGNKAVAAGDYAAAEAHYTAALEALAAAADKAGSEEAHQAPGQRAVLFSNRAHARHQDGRAAGAVEDATVVLALLPEEDASPGTQKLRVKALYRRALAQESLGQLAEAYLDLNRALKMAPTNDGIVAAAKRIKDTAPPGALNDRMAPHAPAWRAEHSFSTRLILQIADSEQFPGRIRGFTPLDSNAVVKFPCGLGVAVYHGHGGLAAIQPFGPPKLLPRQRERLDTGQYEPTRGPPELGDEYFTLPNMRPGDGLHLRYGKGGDLRWIQRYVNGEPDGLALRLEPEGFLKYEECGVYRRGRLVEKWQNCLLPEGYLCSVLTSLAVPVKKALGLALSPCERRLCFENYVDVDGVPPADLTAGHTDDPETPQQLTGKAIRTREWWRPQVQVVDPDETYEVDLRQRGLFAPVGPSLNSTEVLPKGLASAPLPLGPEQA